MSNLFTEDTYEQAVIELFEGMGYEHIYAPDYDRDYTSPFLDAVLYGSLLRINRNLPEEAVKEAILKLKNFDMGSLLQKNIIFMDYLQNGITVKILVKGEEQSVIVRLVDYGTVDNNSFCVVNQFTFLENGNNRRPDIILFINGMPLVLMELKSPSKDEVDVENAYHQIRNYMQDIPSMFYYNAICVVSDLSTNKAGTITSGLDRFMEWKTKDGNYEETSYAQFDTFYEGMFQKKRLLDILKNFILFSGTGTGRFKVLAGYHQYFAVRKAIEKAKIATKTDGKGGVFWHTQGSGKSLSMVFYAHLLQEALDSPTIVVMTDRIDLDDQLYAQFSQCADFLRQTPVQAESKEHLKTLLDGRSANGIIFTTMFKFERGEKPLSERRNIVVMADEAHRGQYGFEEKIVLSENEAGEKEARTVIGNARIIHDALPNATFIGFTGTPISAKDRNTREVFGEYIDVYDMTQAVEDGATRPVYYESRVVHLKLDQNTLALIDSTYDILEQQSDAATIEKSKKMLGQMESVLGADSTIASLCNDIVEHYEKNREHLLTGKAMIVAYSRTIAMKIYRRILEIRPTWKEKIGVVMTGGNNDPEDWKEIIGTKAHKEELARKFKDDNDPMNIAIVVDMWLTGFDVPELDTIYIDKPIQQHTLIQTISRVNRVCEGKDKGLIVDYIGIKKNMNTALKKYTNFESEEFEGVEQSITIVKDQLEVLGQMFHNFNSSDFFNGSPTEQLACLNRAVEYVQLSEELERRFMAAVKRMKQAFNLCSSSEKFSDEDKDYIHFYCAVRSILFKLTKGDAPDIEQMNARVRKMLEGAIQSDGIEELFETGKHISVDIFSDEYMDKINAIQLPNTKIKILQRLLSQAIDEFKKVNKIMGVEFADRLKKVVDEYNNRRRDEAYANEVLDDVAEQLAQLLSELKTEKNSFKNMGIDYEEKAFYDILKAVSKKFEFEYPDDKMIELSKRIKLIVDDKSRYTDWSARDDIKANLQVDLILLLDEFGYPPVTIDDVYKEVLEQAENFKKYAQ